VKEGTMRVARASNICEQNGDVYTWSVWLYEYVGQESNKKIPI
jgi:hypothetical protein